MLWSVHGGELARLPPASSADASRESSSPRARALHVRSAVTAMPMFLNAALILSPLLLAPIMIPCVMKGPVAAFTEIMAGEGVDMPASVMTHPFVVHVLVIDMGKNFLCIALGLYAALLTSHLPTKKAVALLLACQSSWAMFVAWGFASPKVEDATKPYLEIMMSPLLIGVCAVPILLLVSSALLASEPTKSKKK